MNGFGLLIAVAALGVDVGWEAGPGGQSYYTVHIEKLLLEPLREGQAIVSNVDANDRNLSRFQIVVGDHAHAISSQPGSNGRDMVQHGWRPGENGGTDYLIQISPERLESLAKGSTIIGQIDPQVTDIRKLYVFSGVQQLPQQLATAAGSPPPPKFLGTGGGLRTASGETTQPTGGAPRVGSTQFNGSQFNGNAAPTGVDGGYGGSAGGPAKNGFNTFPTGATGDPRATTPDAWRTSGQANAGWPAGTQGNSGAYGTDNRMLPVPQLPQQQNPPNGYAANPPVTQQTFAPPVQPGYGQPGYSQPNQPYGATGAAYSGTPPTTSQDVESQIAKAKAMWDLEAKAAAAEEKAAAAAASALAAKTSAETPSTEKAAEEPWMPLIITTLMLFTSLAVNVFLGWLAWSFFWRFRDAAGDATRAQSTLFPTRQAA